MGVEVEKESRDVEDERFLSNKGRARKRQLIASKKHVFHNATCRTCPAGRVGFLVCRVSFEKALENSRAKGTETNVSSIRETARSSLQKGTTRAHLGRLFDASVNLSSPSLAIPSLLLHSSWKSSSSKIA